MADTSIRIPPGREKELESIFVARLRFVLINDREGRIPDSYKKTFEWIFESKRSDLRSWSNFKDWLQSSEPLYWITGKAGSGKSTLMKYICRENCTLHPTCRESLQKWADDSKLVTANFYFWNSGSRLQMSQSGLFRSLLCQLLDQARDAIPSISPIRWEALCLFNNLDNPDEWPEQELQGMLQKAVSHISGNGLKVCLFIDGLDEFDGNHHQLITLFSTLISFPNVKLCVASRPWIIFEDAFKHKPSLMLQDLTYPDIQHFVNSKFLEDDNYKRLCQRDPDYANRLIENVAYKSAGVFLWVHLVVFSLLTGMSEGDRISDLQKRLDALPADLETLYAKILSTIDAIHLQNAVEIFQLMQASVAPPSLLLLSFADEENSEFALNLQMWSISVKQVSYRVEDMRRRLISRCKGLVDVNRIHADSTTTEGNYTVQYLHRSVKDFLQSAGVQKDLQAATKSTFDPHLRLCAAHLCWLKISTTQPDDVKWSHVDSCLKHAAQIQKTNGEETIRLLNDLDRTGYNVLRHHETRGDSCWVNLQRLLQKDHIVAQSLYGFNFMTLPVIYGITDYVNAKTHRGCFVVAPVGEKWPLLIDITYHCLSSNGAVLSDQARLEMVSCLLRKGANPNVRVDGITHNYSPWTAIIRGAVGVKLAEHLPSKRDDIFYDPKNTDLWLQIARLMIKYGASTSRRTIRKSIVGQFDNSNSIQLSEGERMEVKEGASKAAEWLLNECGLKSKWSRLRARLATGWRIQPPTFFEGWLGQPVLPNTP